MQIDFHYYCIFVLANLAGYTQDEAKIIAYCSQFVDDSLDSEQVNVGGYKYDTVRTAHAGIKSFSWNVHKKIYFPFHFIPARPVDELPFSYITQADSEFAQQLFDAAMGDNTDLKLYRMGVAIHTYADTWAHEHFSGRKDNENDVRRIWKHEKNKWKSCMKPWDYLVDFFRAHVGHIQAFKHPDYAYEYWRYNDYRNKQHQRRNSEHFLEAAKAIFRRLASAKGTANADAIWQQNAQKLQSLFENRPGKGEGQEQRCNKWVEQYKSYFESSGDDKKYCYNPKEWRDKAMRTASDGKLSAFLETDWVKFQRAALKQRYFVLERLM